MSLFTDIDPKLKIIADQLQVTLKIDKFLKEAVRYLMEIKLEDLAKSKNTYH